MRYQPFSAILFNRKRLIFVRDKFEVDGYCMGIYFGDLLDKTISYDGKKYIWNEVYFKIYQHNFVEEKLILKYENGRYYINTKLCYEDRETRPMKFSGDIIFNFFEDGPNKRGKRRLYYEMKRIIENERILAEKNNDEKTIQQLKDVEDLLEQCNRRTESKVNVSLMPITGGLQFVKQGVGRDRFDTFLWCLSEHYNGKSVMYNHCAADYIVYLRSFFDLFESVYEYCECIYNLDVKDDRDLVDRLIVSGSKPIDCWERVREYAQLADMFWHRRIEEYQKFDVKNPQRI